MSNENIYNWVDFYKEFAQKLLPYKNNREDLIEKVKDIFKISGLHMPKLEKDNNIIDIDPFTIFGLFNKHINENNRIKLVTTISDLFDIKSPVPTSFVGIPILNNQNAMFYYDIDSRGEHDIDYLWGLFESALNYAKNQNEENLKEVSKYFDLAINLKGNGNSKITMGLYWIDSDTFINLDKPNLNYIYESGKFPNNLPEIRGKISSEEYFNLLKIIQDTLKKEPDKSLYDLSFDAYKYAHEDLNEEVNYWVYSPGKNAIFWNDFFNKGIMAIGWDSIGDLNNFSSQNKIKEKMKEVLDPELDYKNDSYAVWQFSKEMKPGDIIIAIKGRNQIIGRGIVDSEYYFDDTREQFKNVRKVKWINNEELPYPGNAPLKTLTNKTSDTTFLEAINELFKEEPPEVNLKSYEIQDFLSEVYMDEENYNTLTSLLDFKKNLILQGPPGVGKTYAAKRLAYSIMGVKDPERVMMVQFHQSYSYEDFIMGFRPSNNEFKLKYGAFYKFCKKAEIDSDNPYFFIIDEINRGNLSKIFGELFMLIENDKRGIELQLLYSDEKFSIPENVYIIGMMNTADRSLALLDYALRRRFSFFEMKPGFKTDGFRKYQKNLNSPQFDRLVDCIENLNIDIANDETLGEGFCIGHSYLSNLDEVTDQNLSNIVEFELIPLIKEYWFDEPSKVRDWSNNLRNAIK